MQSTPIDGVASFMRAVITGGARLLALLAASIASKAATAGAVASAGVSDERIQNVTPGAATGLVISLRPLSLVLFASAITSFSSGAFAYLATAYLPTGNAFGTTVTPGDVQYVYQSGGSSGVVSFTTSPIASVDTEVSSSNASGQHSMTGGGIMTYTFLVEAQANTWVPVDFSGLYSSFVSTAGQGAYSSTQFTIQSTNSNQNTYSNFQSTFQGPCGAPTCLSFTTFNNTTYTSTLLDQFNVEGSFEGTLEMLTGADGTVAGSVQLVALALTNAFFTPASSAAFIDPHLAIDPAFLKLNPDAKLTLEFGIGNEITTAQPNGVPEPSTLAMVGLALLGLNAARRMRVA